MGAKRFILSCFVACIIIGCGGGEKDNPQAILMKWSAVREGMTDVEIAKLLGKPNSRLVKDGETVYFYSSGLSERELRQKGLQLSDLVLSMTNNVVNQKHIIYQ